MQYGNVSRGNARNITMKKQIFKITGMHCTSCAMNIDGEIEDTEKVKNVKTSYAKQETEVEYDPEEITEEEIIKAVEKAGYTATPLTDK